MRQFNQVCRTEPTFSRSQDGDGIFRGKIGPVQWNLTLAAFLVEETDSLFTAVFFATQSFKLAARERMKGMRDPKLLGLCSTNGCSPTPLSLIRSTQETRSVPQVRGGPKNISPYLPQLDRRPNAPYVFQEDSQTDNSAPSGALAFRIPVVVCWYKSIPHSRYIDQVWSFVIANDD
jgi:hypothetical protein